MTRALIAVSILFLVGYGLFEARKLLEGPVIVINSPRDGAATSTALVVVDGVAQNVAFLTVNDAPAYTDQSGHFVEKLSPPPGYTVITVAAVDRFGRRASKSVSFTIVNYCPV